MSKRVLIALAAGLVLIAGAFLLFKYEKDQELKLYDELEADPEPEPKVRKSKKATDEQKQAEEPGTITGTGSNNEPGTDEPKE